MVRNLSYCNVIHWGAMRRCCLLGINYVVSEQSQSQWGICRAPLTKLDSGTEHVKSSYWWHDVIFWYYLCSLHSFRTTSWSLKSSLAPHFIVLFTSTDISKRAFCVALQLTETLFQKVCGWQSQLVLNSSWKLHFLKSAVNDIMFTSLITSESSCRICGAV